ncbi:MAG: L-threonylcarbamoyladenylate synthase [Saprospiraceae bacterium]|nr:L-threonylcarbamoyladenylate synthase [Saprospiraceae bacterium]
MTEVDQIIEALSHGGTIIYPTDTIWGLGCDATNELAVERIYQIKNRPKSKPFVILVSSIQMLKDYVNDVHPRLETLLSYHERPLTVIHKSSKNLPPNVIGKTGSVAVRITHDRFCCEIIDELGKPIVATSANFTHQPFPTHFGSISSELIRKVDYVVKYKQDVQATTEPSIIVKISEKSELIFVRN